MDGREHVVLDDFSLGYCLLATVGEERYGDVRMYPPFPCIFLIAFTLQSLHLCGGAGTDSALLQEKHSITLGQIGGTCC